MEPILLVLCVILYTSLGFCALRYLLTKFPESFSVGPNLAVYTLIIATWPVSLLCSLGATDYPKQQ